VLQALRCTPPNPDLGPYAHILHDAAPGIRMQHAVPVLNLGADGELALQRAGLLRHNSDAALHKVVLTSRLMQIYGVMK